MSLVGLVFGGKLEVNTDQLDEVDMDWWGWHGQHKWEAGSKHQTNWGVDFEWIIQLQTAFAFWSCSSFASDHQ